MPSLDFELERSAFRDFYNDNSLVLEDAKRSLIALLSALLSEKEGISVSKIEGRIKDREECISKFIRKYRSELELKQESYSIKNHITDLIGIRVVCLYESDISSVLDVLRAEFDVIGVTNKSAEIEGTDATFGYKGVHADLKLKGKRAELTEYKRFREYPFEVQIRTLVQDAWSVVDHKIKYKKSIPQHMKRRINTLAALFELADREFLAIRLETEKQVKVAEESYPEIEKESESSGVETDQSRSKRFTPAVLDAFSFLKIANHFFPDFYFEDHKVDGFVEEIQFCRPGTTRGKFNFYLKSTIGRVKDYAEFRASVDGRRMNPFTLMRYCLYLGDQDAFDGLLSTTAKEELRVWQADSAKNLWK